MNFHLRPSETVPVQSLGFDRQPIAEAVRPGPAGCGRSSLGKGSAHLTKRSSGMDARDLTWWIVQVERALKHLRAVCYVKPRAKALLTSPLAICPSKHLARGPSDVGLPAPWLTYGQYRDWRTRPN
jgi:hypothetical protein